MAFTRYAIYYTPPPGAWAAFGAAWLGWDAARGLVDHLDIPGLPLPLPEITQSPRRYGFHATIKPPFRLVKGCGEADLRRAFEGFCAAASPATTRGLELAQLGRFLALVPSGDDAALNDLAAAAVGDLDAFRAPPTEDELLRRRGTGLRPDQEMRLQKWGYPHVMEGFRFHMTLTGKLPKAQAAQVSGVLAQRLIPLLPAPFTVNALTLMGEDAQGFFHALDRCALGPA